MSYKAHEGEDKENKAITSAEGTGVGVDDVDEEATLTEDLDIEMALLALSTRDVGGPTETVDLGSLSPTEKRILLEMLRRRMYGSDAPVPPTSPEADAGND